MCYVKQRFVGDGRVHTDVFCPQCGAEMTGFEFNRTETGNCVIWECFRKCPTCGCRVKWKDY